MRYVDHAAMRPNQCAVIPFIGNSNATKGFIDTGNDLQGWDPHVYVSVDAVEEMARFIGWQPAQAEATQFARVQAKVERIAVLEAELAEARKLNDAAEYTLGRFGAKVQHKPGRKAAA